jgi:ferredoxin-NADP reductase
VCIGDHFRIGGALFEVTQPRVTCYRVGIRMNEPQMAALLVSHGRPGFYFRVLEEAADNLEVSAPRGSFTLRPGEGPVVLASAGIGVTPVLAMLHALAAGHSRREIWWVHGARNSSEHPFAAEVRELLKTLPASRSHICYRAPQPTDRPSIDFDRVGRVGVSVFGEIGVPPDAEFYICGPAAFMTSLVDGLAGYGVARDRLYTENFGSGPAMTPGLPRCRGGPRIRRPIPPGK